MAACMYINIQTQLFRKASTYPKSHQNLMFPMIWQCVWWYKTRKQLTHVKVVGLKVKMVTASSHKKRFDL
eukprot:1943068-Amphidinium_carterae.1